MACDMATSQATLCPNVKLARPLRAKKKSLTVNSQRWAHIKLACSSLPHNTGTPTPLLPRNYPRNELSLHQYALNNVGLPKTLFCNSPLLHWNCRSLLESTEVMPFPSLMEEDAVSKWSRTLVVTVVVQQIGLKWSQHVPATLNWKLAHISL